MVIHIIMFVSLTDEATIKAKRFLYAFEKSLALHCLCR